MRQLADILLDAGLVDEPQLAAAYDEHQRAGRSLGRVLVDQDVISETQLVAALAEQIGLPFVDLTEYAIDGSAVALVPAAVCRRHVVLPIGYDGGRLVLAMADPANVFAVDDVRSLSGLEPRPVVATREDLVVAIERLCRADGDLDDLGAALDEGPESEDLSSVTKVVDEAPIVRYVNLLITQAISDRASDIHIEPDEHDLRVRYRIDGVLHDVQRSPRGIPERRDLPAEDHGRHRTSPRRRVPQDGRLSVSAQGRKVDLRVATLPTVWGEKVVDAHPGQLDTPGWRWPTSASAEHNYGRYAASYTKPYGMILVTGPTGSGKSTTLYATLNQRQPARGQRDHRRGPGGVPAARDQPGAGQHQGRAHLRLRAALDPALRPGHRADR